MRPDDADAAHLLDMLEAAETVSAYVRGRTLADYERDQMLRDAVERRIEIIGEAAGRVSEPFRDAHPEIPWKGIIGQRHVLAHDYGEIIHERIWRVATDRICELIANLRPLVPREPPAASDQASSPEGG